MSRILDLYEEELKKGRGVTFEQFLINMEKRRPTPEEVRTQEFFNQSVSTLARKLRNMVIVLEGTNKQIQLTELQAFGYNDVGKRYDQMEDMRPGDLWAAPFPFRRMRQSLIVAKERGLVGACVRVVRASRFDTRSGEFVPMRKEGEIAGYLGLRDNQVCKLEFRDKSDTLYLAK